MGGGKGEGVRVHKGVLLDKGVLLQYIQGLLQGHMLKCDCVMFDSMVVWALSSMPLSSQSLHHTPSAVPPCPSPNRLTLNSVDWNSTQLTRTRFDSTHSGRRHQLG